MSNTEKNIGKFIGVASALWLLYSVFKSEKKTNNFNSNYHNGDGYGGGKPTLNTPK